MKENIFLYACQLGKRTSFRSYLVGSIFIVGFALLGQLPYMGFLYFKTGLEGITSKSHEELMKILPSNLNFFLLMLSFLAAFIGCKVVLEKWHKRSFLSALTSRKKFDLSRFFFAFGVYGSFMAFITFLQYKTNPELFELQFEITPFFTLLILTIIFIPIQSAVEEIVFRGYLMQGFCTLSKNPLFALIMTSVIFGVLHLTNPEFNQYGLLLLTTYIGTGFFFGLISIIDKGTELAIGFHTANNFLGCVLVTSEHSVLPTAAILKDISEVTSKSMGIEILIPIFIVLPAMFWIFYKRYQWKGWRHTFF